MRDYAELVELIRSFACNQYPNCSECEMILGGHECRSAIERQAADAIEELLAKDKNVPDKNVGEWIAVQSNGERFFRCSRCGAFLKESFFNLGYSVNYCPNCGAAMMEVINDA